MTIWMGIFDPSLIFLPGLPLVITAIIFKDRGWHKGYREGKNA